MLVIGNSGIRKKKKSRLNLVQFFYLMTQKKDREARTSDIALVYCGNAFIIFLDNDEQDGWFDELHKDVIAPYTLDA